MSEKEKNAILNDHEMSEKEMEALAGGVNIDWPEQCRDTVENGSSCAVNDACYGVFNSYFRNKSKYGCSATVESSTSTCSSNDNCTFVQIRYDTCTGNVGSQR